MLAFFSNRAGQQRLWIGFALWMFWSVAYPQPIAAQCDPADTIALTPFYELSQPPRFPGGEAALLRFLLGAQYPPLDSTQAIIGKLAVSFIVEADGRVSNICALRHPDHPWTLALMRHLAGLPPFLPGEKAGRPVRVRFNLPIFIRPE